MTRAPKYSARTSNPEPTPAERKRIAAKLEDCSKGLVLEPARRSSEWLDDPKYQSFRQIADNARKAKCKTD
jgi:hypothetical protein